MSFQVPITIAGAIEDIDNNRLLLPAIQREFVVQTGSDQINKLNSLDINVKSCLLFALKDHF